MFKTDVFSKTSQAHGRQEKAKCSQHSDNGTSSKNCKANMPDGGNTPLPMKLNCVVSEKKKKYLPWQDGLLPQPWKLLGREQNHT